jgi:hypothetical protein
MPNRVEDFVPFRLLMFTEDRLKLISKALGYNCDVAVFTDMDDFTASSAKFKLFYDSMSDDTQANFVGDSRLNQALTVQVLGIATYETEWPRRLAFALEQDVRTALHSGFSELRTSYVQRGCSARFGRASHDGGALAPIKQAGFDLSVTFTWSQDSDW